MNVTELDWHIFVLSPQEIDHRLKQVIHEAQPPQSVKVRFWNSEPIGKEIAPTVYQNMDEADLVVAVPYDQDCNLSSNVALECGYAIGTSKRLLLLIDERIEQGTQERQNRLPLYLRNVSYLDFKNDQLVGADYCRELRQRISDHLENILDEESVPRARREFRRIVSSAKPRVPVTDLTSVIRVSRQLEELHYHEGALDHVFEATRRLIRIVNFDRTLLAKVAYVLAIVAVCAPPVAGLLYVFEEKDLWPHDVQALIAAQQGLGALMFESGPIFVQMATLTGLVIVFHALLATMYRRFIILHSRSWSSRLISFGITSLVGGLLVYLLVVAWFTWDGATWSIPGICERPAGSVATRALILGMLFAAACCWSVRTSALNIQSAILAAILIAGVSAMIFVVLRLITIYYIDAHCGSSIPETSWPGEVSASVAGGGVLFVFAFVATTLGRLPWIYLLLPRWQLVPPVRSEVRGKVSEGRS